jgi:hypothetical protein
MRTRHTVAQLVTTEESRRRIEEATGEPAPVFRDRSLEELRERDIASLVASFRRHGIEGDVEQIRRSVIDDESWRRLTRPDAR